MFEFLKKCSRVTDEKTCGKKSACSWEEKSECRISYGLAGNATAQLTKVTECQSSNIPLLTALAKHHKASSNTDSYIILDTLAAHEQCSTYVAEETCGPESA